MSEQIITTTLLVRDVADERLSHGDRTFAVGLFLVIGGGTVVMFAASLLRSLGIA